MTRIYIAGRMKGIPFFNFNAFFEAEAILKSQGYDVVNPAQLDLDAGFDPYLYDYHTDTEVDWNNLSQFPNFKLEDAIDRDIEAIKTCNAIFMLRDWEKSKGATAEKALAEWMGLTVLFEVPPEPPEPYEPYEPAKESILEEAQRLTTVDRQSSYGHPAEHFDRIANLWSGLIGVEFDANDVALMMILVKVSRQKNKHKRDNFVDIAGYANCGNMCAELPMPHLEDSCFTLAP